MSIIPSIAREKSKEKAVGKDKITAVTNAQMLNIKESLNQEVRIRNEEETISFWETKKPQVKTNSEHKIQRTSRNDQTRKKEPPIKSPKDAKGDTKSEPVKQPMEPQTKTPEPEEATAIAEAPIQTP